MPKRAVIYCRVSTKEQVEEGNSLTTQEKICKEYALNHSYEVVEVFIEQGESAKTQNRTEFQRLLNFCTNKKNNIQTVIAYKIDRISRNIDDYSQIRVLLKRYGVEIKSTSEHFENTPAGRFMENIIANVAQFDNDVRTERSINGMRDAMREGRYVWKAPLGYSNMKIGNKSTIVQNEKAHVVRKTFEEVAKNKHSVDVIRRYMYKQGLTMKNGKPITRSYLYQLLKNELYAGWIIKLRERHKGLFDPIVSEELYEQVQRVLKKRSRSNKLYLVENPDFPLRRFMIHPSGTKATGYWARGRNKQYPYYRFMGIKKSDVAIKKVEQAFKAFLNNHALSSEHITYFKTTLENTLNSSLNQELHTAKQLKAKIEDLTKRQTALIEKNGKGIISDSVLRRHLNIIEQELTDTYAELLKLPDNVESIDQLIYFTVDFLKNPAEIWEKASFQQKLKFQWFEFPQGVIYENGKFRTKKIASIFKDKNVFLPSLSSKVPSSGHYFEPINIETAKRYVAELHQLKNILSDNKN